MAVYCVPVRHNAHLVLRHKSKFDTNQNSYITKFERRMNNMKTLITMMNAMKYYKIEELVQEDSIQEQISSDLAKPTFHKMLGTIRQKFFLNRG